MTNEELTRVNSELVTRIQELEKERDGLQAKWDKRFNKPKQEEFSFPTLLKWADEIVKSYPLYKKFIAHTPLDNDCAVWMAEFARNQLVLASFPTTVEEVEREEWRQEKQNLTTLSQTCLSYFHAQSAYLHAMNTKQPDAKELCLKADALRDKALKMAEKIGLAPLT